MIFAARSREPSGTWAITAATDATAVVRSYCLANDALDVAADRQVALPRSHYQLREEGAAELVERLLVIDDRWSSAPRVVAASSIRDC
jgi:hypothetical protein